MKKSLRIIYYHMVGSFDKKMYGGKGISVSEFKEQINYFKHRYNIISLDEAVFLANSRENFNNHLVITFDDGFRSILNYAVPILIDEKLPACIYCIADCVSNKSLMWRNKLEYIMSSVTSEMLHNSLKNLCHEYNYKIPTKKESIQDWSLDNIPMHEKDIFLDLLWHHLMPISTVEFLSETKPYITKEELKELYHNNIITGNHSKTHPLFSKLSFTEVNFELNAGREKLEKLLEKKVRHISYPFGVRPNFEFEARYISENVSYVSSVCGVRNRYSNYNNIYKWERDRLEMSGMSKYIRFYFLPLARKIIPV